MKVFFHDEELNIIGNIFGNQLSESSYRPKVDPRLILDSSTPLERKVLKAITILNEKLTESPSYAFLYDSAIDSVKHKDSSRQATFLENFRDSFMCINDYILLENYFISEGKSKDFIKNAVEHVGSFKIWCKGQGYNGVNSSCIDKGLKSKNHITKKRAVLAHTLQMLRKKKKKK
jgi:hypothetical protein